MGECFLSKNGHGAVLVKGHPDGFCAKILDFYQSWERKHQCFPGDVSLGGGLQLGRCLGGVVVIYILLGHCSLHGSVLFRRLGGFHIVSLRGASAASQW